MLLLLIYDVRVPAFSSLKPSSYLHKTVDYLKSEESRLWAWYASEASWAFLQERTRLELHRGTARLSRLSHRRVFDALDRALAALELDMPVAIYHASVSSTGNNAALFYIPGEIHIVLFAHIEQLEPDELSALIGRELSLYLLWSLEEGIYYIADRILSDGAGSNDACIQCTAERYQRHIELFVDCGAVLCGGLVGAVRCVVKMTTDLRDLSEEAYIAQAEEVLKHKAASRLIDRYPENFVRILAMKAYAEGKSIDELELRSHAKQGQGMAGLDIHAQVKLHQLTRMMLADLISVDWFRTESVCRHAQLFFSDIDRVVPNGTWRSDLLSCLPESETYWVYVLLDFCSVDSSLGEAALVYVLQFSEPLGLRSPLEKAINKELGVTKKRLGELKREATAIISIAEKMEVASENV